MAFKGLNLRGYFRYRQTGRFSFGILEREAMEYVWRKGEVSVRDLHEELRGRAAYTTLMTTLDRLHKKGFLTRRKLNRAYLYTARYSNEQLEQGIATDLFEALLSQATHKTAPVLSCFVDAVSVRDQALLDELERLVKEKRSALKGKE